MLYLLVTGSRTWDDSTYIWNQIGKLYIQHRALEIHHGACPEGGADEHANNCGNAMRLAGASISVVPHPMNITRHGRKAAGPIRNTEMVEIFKGFINKGYKVACHAFHRDNSRGTNDCAFKALMAGIPTVTHVLNGGGPIRTVFEEQLAMFEVKAA